ncbi:Vps54-like protein-domain-containing protein [Xylogone sp. PMI_703]|nr:Vps54-like protein-domain-containing protein [Xylogone sp. PMI_703]
MSMASPRMSVESSSPGSPPSRNEYPFPRLSSVNRHGFRRGSTASSIQSIGGALDTASHWSDLSEASQNAISTLLQPPIVRTGLVPYTSAPASTAHKPPTARDIPPVTLTNITQVDPAEFKQYLSQVGALYDSLQRAKENEDDGGTQLFRRTSRADEFADLVDPALSPRKPPSLSRQASLVSLASSIETPAPRKRSSGGYGRRAAHAPTPLSTIPNVYFDEDFHLENPRTFDVVSERSEVIRPSPGSPDDQKVGNGASIGPRKALATNAILQEKLSWYMDTIEIHLIASISTASSSFFAALGSLRELHSEAANSVAQIKQLRKELQELDREVAVGGLDIVNKRRRMENLKQLSDAVQQLKQIVQNIAACEELVDNGEVEKALDAIDALEGLIAGDEHGQTPNQSKSNVRLRDLRGATALQGVSNDMDTLRFRIGKEYEIRFMNALLDDLKAHITSVSASEILQRWSSASQRNRGNQNRDKASNPSYLIMSEDFKSNISSNLKGLQRAKFTSHAAAAYREAVLREVRNIIRRPLPSSNEDDADSMMSASTVGGRQRTQQEKSSILARNLRSLDPEDAEELYKKTYIGVGETLRRLGTQVKQLLDVTSTLNVTGTDGQEMHQALDMSNLLGQVVDIAQDKIVKVLRVRTEQSVHLSVERFLRYFTLNLLFANECEAISGRSGTSLKNVVNGHITEYVKLFSESERQKLATGMEADSWNAKDFTDSDKEQLTRILSASTEDVEAWCRSSSVWLPSSESENLSSPPVQSNGVTKDKTRSAVIDSESFILPASAILCLHGLSRFLHLNTGLRSMTSEIATSIVSYLTLFNSRCTQLILGAGATRSAGLKNITTKHLALAAQAVSFISTLIPHIREFVRRNSGNNTTVSSLMGEFDKVRRSFQEHQQSIYDKLVDIMAGRATAHTKSMRTVNWNTETTAVNPYMETLTKETSTLHRVLSKHLPEMTVRMIMEPVFKNYKEQWGRAFGEVVLENAEAKARMLRDVEYFKSRIGNIAGAEDAGDYLIGIVNAKTVPEPPAPAPATAPAPANGEAPTNGAHQADASPNGE